MFVTLHVREFTEGMSKDKTLKLNSPQPASMLHSWKDIYRNLLPLKQTILIFVHVMNKLTMK